MALHKGRACSILEIGLAVNDSLCVYSKWTFERLCCTPPPSSGFIADVVSNTLRMKHDEELAIPATVTGMTKAVLLVCGGGSQVALSHVEAGAVFSNTLLLVNTFQGLHFAATKRLRRVSGLDK